MCLSLSILLSALGVSIANIALPALAEAFNASFQDVQWIVLAYLLTITTVIVSAGRLGDMAGHRCVLLWGLAVFTLASAACAAAPTLALLIFARAVQGLGAAVMMALTVAMVSGAVAKEKTGSAMGLLGTMSAVGTALGPSLGGILIAKLGWAAVFYINIPLGLLALALGYRYLPLDSPQPSCQAGFDGMGTALLAASLVAYALSMTLGRGAFGALNAALLLAGILGLGLFAFAETKTVSPLIRPAMLRNRVLSTGLVMNLLVMAVVMATLIVGPFYLSGALMLDAVTVGLCMSVGPVVTALMGVPAGRAVDRFGPGRMTVVGLAGMLAGASLLAVMPVSAGVAGYVVPLALLTAGYAQVQAANNTTIMTAAPDAHRGVVSGLLNLSRNLGLITGASAMGAVFALASRSHEAGLFNPEAAAAGLRATFAVAAGLVAVAALAAVISQARARLS
ncbi:MAG: MFS transporter [Rhodospirillaceae bacterium]|nr:MFS transporter [Rhodospirillaceae bacterium]